MTIAKFESIKQNIESAKRIHPSNYKTNWNGKDNETWCNVEDVVVEYIGAYHLHSDQEEGVILASFNAG